MIDKELNNNKKNKTIELNNNEENKTSKRLRNKIVLVTTMIVLGVVSFITSYSWVISKGKTPIKENPYSKESLTPAREKEKNKFDDIDTDNLDSKQTLDNSSSHNQEENYKYVFDEIQRAEAQRAIEKMGYDIYSIFFENSLSSNIKKLKKD